MGKKILSGRVDEWHGRTDVAGRGGRRERRRHMPGRACRAQKTGMG